MKGVSIMTKRTIKSCSVKSLAILLSVLMIFYLIPATAYASLFEATEAESVVSEPAEYTGEIFEDISIKLNKSKTFKKALEEITSKYPHVDFCLQYC